MPSAKMSYKKTRFLNIDNFRSCFFLNVPIYHQTKNGDVQIRAAILANLAACDSKNHQIGENDSGKTEPSVTVKSRSNGKTLLKSVQKCQSSNP